MKGFSNLLNLFHFCTVRTPAGILGSARTKDILSQVLRVDEHRFMKKMELTQKSRPLMREVEVPSKFPQSQMMEDTYWLEIMYQEKLISMKKMILYGA